MAQSNNCNEPEELTRTSRDDCEQAVTSRRAVLRQCSSIFSAVALASAWDRRDALASEFSDSSVLGEVVERQPPVQNTAPQFYDESVITPPKPLEARGRGEAPESNPAQPESSVSVAQQGAPESGSALPEPSASATALASNLPPPTAEVTLENSQVVQVPVANPAQSDQASPEVTPSPTLTSPNVENDDDGNPLFIAEVTAVAAVLGATLVAVSGEVEGNTDDFSPKCKIVMIENEPYGLDTGRRWYNGVDITINDPIPASDIREYCEAGKVNDDCTQTITGFLGEVSTTGSSGKGPTTGQQEAAMAVLSYLDSLNHVGGPTSSKTAEAFSSYLNVLSNGEVDAPASPKLVAEYLDSIGSEGVRRLSTIEDRVNELESSVDRLPEEISGRLVQWQEEQDERLTREFDKIQSFLMNANKEENELSPPVNGEGYPSKLLL